MIDKIIIILTNNSKGVVKFKKYSHKYIHYDVFLNVYTINKYENN